MKRPFLPNSYSRWSGSEEERVRKERIDQERRLDKLRQNLMRNLRRWEHAQRLREFIQATVEASSPDEASQMALASWVSWATQQVELLDPLKVNISNVIDLAVDLPSTEYGYWCSGKKEGDWWP